MEIARRARRRGEDGVQPDRNGPAGTAGLHRYIWDMRYPDAQGIDGGTFLAGGNLRGPVAFPAPTRSA